MEAKISTQTDIVTGLGRFWGELGFETHLRRGVEALGIPKARCFNCNRCKSKQTNKQQQEQKTESICDELGKDFLGMLPKVSILKK